MGFVVALIIIIFIFAIAISKDNPRRIEKMYTKDGYPKTDVLVINFNNAPQGMDVVISCTPNELIFKGNGIDKKILHKDIVDITLQTVNNESNTSEFSYGRAIVGTAVLGTVGAIAGISGKKKQDLEMLIISYTENNEVEYLTFLQQTKKEYPINTEAFFLKEAIKRIEEVRAGRYTPFKI